MERNSSRQTACACRTVRASSASSQSGSAVIHASRNACDRCQNAPASRISADKTAAFSSPDSSAARTEPAGAAASASAAVSTLRPSAGPEKTSFCFMLHFTSGPARY